MSSQPINQSTSRDIYIICSYLNKETEKINMNDHHKIASQGVPQTLGQYCTWTAI